MYGSYFFLSHEMHEHSRQVFNILALLAVIGGLFSSASSSIALIAVFINGRAFMSNMINEMYFYKTKQEKSAQAGS